MKALRYVLLAVVLMALTAREDHAQNITNTLGTGGVFTIKDAANNYFSLSQVNGNTTFYRNLELGNQEISSSTVGVITKGGLPFIHNYKSASGDGFNTFAGINAGNFTMGGSFNYQASNNTGVGYESLTSLSTGRANSALGTQSLYSNTAGNLNSAFGFHALQFNTTGNNNSAFGFYSLISNTSGIGNSAVGGQSLYSNTEGYANSAVGGQSLYSNIGGYRNCAFGYSSLNNSTTGYNNTAVGFGAGDNVYDGSNLTLLGYEAQASSGSATNEITLGDINVTQLRCNTTTITALSDARDKKNIRDLNLGLNFLMKVKPRLFNWDRREWYEDHRADGSKMEQAPTAGFIAQELDEAQTNEEAEWLSLVLKSNPDRLEATPGNLLPVVVKAVQELKNQKDEEIAELRKENESLKGRILAQQQEIENIKELKAKVAVLEQAIAQPSLVQGVGMIEERDTNKK